MTVSNNNDEDWGDDSPIKNKADSLVYEDDDVHVINDSGVRDMSRSQSKNKNVGISLVKKNNMRSN